MPRRSARQSVLALPLLLWLIWFLLLPLAFVAVYSVLQRGPYGNIVPQPGFANYARAMDPLYLGILARSFGLAALTTAVCTLMAVPVAYTLATAKESRRPYYFAGLMLPFLTNFLVRIYALRALLAQGGPLSLLIAAFGGPELSLTDSWGAVAIGMIINYLPFTVLPIYVVLERFDFTLLEAARDLGAHGTVLLRRVLLPLLRPGLLGGAILTFIPTLGEFMIPDLLGGARTMLLGSLITEQFLKTRDWPFGAALAMLLVGVTAVLFGLQARLDGAAWGVARRAP